MAAAWELDHRIGRLVRRILAEVSAGGARGSGDWKRPEREINRIFERDYALSLRQSFGAAEITHLVGTASAIWPHFNRAPMGPPSTRLFMEVSEHLSLHFSSAPYRRRGGFAIRGFYLSKTPAALGKPLIYVNSAHHPLAIGTAFCHEVGHHLSAEMFCDSGAQPRTRFYLGTQCLARMDDRVELAADIIVSLAGYPKPIAGQIFCARAGGNGFALPLGARGGKAFDAVREHLRSRYGFDFTAAIAPAQKLHYLAGMIHFARLREALLAEFDV